MDQEPPLPYAGAINLKHLLQNPQLLNDPTHITINDGEVKKKGDSDISQTQLRNQAFLGNPIWDAGSIIPCSDINDFKVELLDNDDFWNELNSLNALSDVGQLADLMSAEGAPGVGSPGAPRTPQQPSPNASPPHDVMRSALLHSPGGGSSPALASALSPSSSAPSSPEPPKQKFYEKYSPDALVLASVPGEGLFNPGKRKFNTDELKPQPVIKKSRKTFVPEDLKDDRYWARRQKNNTAAKRSRDAKRIKENQIALRAGFLEEEVDYLKKELAQYKAENKALTARLQKYEPDFM